jgi:A/G-specific adenine glycosylase
MPTAVGSMSSRAAAVRGSSAPRRAVPERAASDALRALPGIGRYTAGAVLSFAYGRDAAILDTNVRRVLGRVFLGPRRLARVRGDRRFWELAESLVPPGRCYDFNQALMDFGATWCTPRAPRCPRCPMRRLCATYPTLARRL